MTTPQEQTPEDRRKVGEEFGIANPDKMREEINRIVDQRLRQPAVKSVDADYGNEDFFA